MIPGKVTSGKSDFREGNFRRGRKEKERGAEGKWLRISGDAGMQVVRRRPPSGIRHGGNDAVHEGSTLAAAVFMGESRCLGNDNLHLEPVHQQLVKR